MIFQQLFFWCKRVLDLGPEQRESKLTVLCLLIIIILISYIIIYVGILCFESEVFDFLFSNFSFK